MSQSRQSLNIEDIIQDLYRTKSAPPSANHQNIYIQKQQTNRSLFVHLNQQEQLKTSLDDVIVKYKKSELDGKHIKQSEENNQIYTFEKKNAEQLVQLHNNKSQQIYDHFDQAQLTHYKIFQSYYENIISRKNTSQQIKLYFLSFIEHSKNKAYLEHFTTNNILNQVIQIMKKQKYSSDMIKIVFQSIEILFQKFNDFQEFYDFAESIANSGLLDQGYQLIQQQDQAYFTNFLKLLTRKINQNSQYLYIFFNENTPNFPVMNNLLRFHSNTDTILHTTTKLAIMDISNNPNPYIQKYISNFPFVVFYPYYVQPIATYLDQLINIEKEEQKIYFEADLENSIQFMEDFVKNKSKQIISMYTNSFFYLVGKKIYRELENEKNQIKILKILCKILPQITTPEIKNGFQQMFKKYLTKEMLTYFQAQIQYLTDKDWLLAKNKKYIKSHCEEVIIFQNSKEKKQKKGSWIQTMYSYIPQLHLKYLNAEFKKISEIIGVEIELNKPIDHEIYNSDSFLVIQSLQQPKSFQNPIFQSIVHKRDNQQVLYWFLKVATEITCIDEDSLASILHQISKCNSLSVVRQFYEVVIRNDLQFVETVYLTHHYSEITQKIIYFLLKQSWKAFENKAKICQILQFYQDNSRKIDCDIIYFAALRHILGTSNNTCSQLNKVQFQYLNEEYKKLKFKCNLHNFEGQSIYFILDGQYIQLQSLQGLQLINHPLLLRDFTFYQQNQSFQIISKTNQLTQQNYRIQFPQSSVCQFIAKQVKKRKQNCITLELQLKTLKYPQL